jgi:hypothetical protein
MAHEATMACEKHGYTNPTFCPACDLEVIERATGNTGAARKSGTITPRESANGREAGALNVSRPGIQKAKS